MAEENDRRIFLGWDRPVVDLVVEHLVAGHNPKDGPIDLDGILIVVPTRQAGRRLREALARWCDDNATTLLSAKTVMPHFLIGQEILPSNVAGSVTRQAIWINLLLNTDLGDYTALFPSASGDRSFQWASNTADILEQLRQELGDAALTIEDVVSQHGQDLEEPDRWAAMLELEKRYLAELNRLGFTDKSRSKINAIANAASVVEADRVVMAGVPDPSLLALEALKVIVREKPVEVLVHAPEDHAKMFDEWGRPDPKEWAQHHVDIDEFESSVYLEAGPAEQSRRVLRLIQDNAGDYESGEIAIGVPDSGLIPFLAKDLGAEGLPPFDPADLRVSEHALGRLASVFLSVLQLRSYDAVAGLLRHPDFAKYLAGQHELSVKEVLSQLDQFQNCYLPVNLEGMLKPFADDPKGTDEWRYDFTELGKALKVVESVCNAFSNASFEEAWRGFFGSVYSIRKISSASARDSQFESAAMEIDAVLRDFRELDGCGVDLSKNQLSAIFVSQLDGATYHAERHDEVVDLEGWLELPWNDRQFLLLSGMNDNFVPGGSMSDVFLPDSLRGRLGLRDDRARFARDVYLFEGMVQSRRAEGRVRFVLGKTSSAGDPLRPSRILFRCPDEELPARVEKLLASIEDKRPRHASEVIFQLKPGAPERVNDVQRKRRISVTALRDYLACPFRFYLRHVLRMEELDDRKTELDQLDFGNIVHAVLEAMGRDKDIWSCTDAGRLSGILGDLAHAHVAEKYTDPMPLSVRISLMAALQRLKGAARVQAQLAADGWEILEAEAGEDYETRKRWQLERGGFTISGRIDRIDRHRDTGAIRIIDYKSSDKAKKPVEAHMKKHNEGDPEWNRFTELKHLKTKTSEKQLKWIDLQLPIYALIYAQGKNVPADTEIAYFNLPKAVSTTGVYVWNGFGPEHMKSAEACLDGALAAISNGEFWEPAARVMYDNFEDLFVNDPEKAFDVTGLQGRGQRTEGRRQGAWGKPEG